MYMLSLQNIQTISEEKRKKSRLIPYLLTFFFPKPPQAMLEQLVHLLRYKCIMLVSKDILKTRDTCI